MDLRSTDCHSRWRGSSRPAWVRRSSHLLWLYRSAKRSSTARARLHPHPRVQPTLRRSWVGHFARYSLGAPERRGRPRRHSPCRLRRTRARTRTRIADTCVYGHANAVGSLAADVPVRSETAADGRQLGIYVLAAPMHPCAVAASIADDYSDCPRAPGSSPHFNLHALSVGAPRDGVDTRFYHEWRDALLSTQEGRRMALQPDGPASLMASFTIVGALPALKPTQRRVRRRSTACVRLLPTRAGRATSARPSSLSCSSCCRAFPTSMASPTVSATTPTSRAPCSGVYSRGGGRGAAARGITHLFFRQPRPHARRMRPSMTPSTPDAQSAASATPLSSKREMRRACPFCRAVRSAWLSVF